LSAFTDPFVAALATKILAQCRWDIRFVPEAGVKPLNHVGKPHSLCVTCRHLSAIVLPINGGLFAEALALSEFEQI